MKEESCKSETKRKRDDSTQSSESSNEDNNSQGIADTETINGHELYENNDEDDDLLIDNNEDEDKNECGTELDKNAVNKTLESKEMSDESLAEKLIPPVDDASKTRRTGKRRSQKISYSEDGTDDSNKTPDDELPTCDKPNNRLNDQDESQDNDYQSGKRVLRRSTTSLRDSLIYREDYSGDECTDDKNDNYELPAKRRRKKKRPRTASDSDHSDAPLPDLEQGYKVLKQIMAFSRAAPFVETPNESAYGMKEYFTVITKPMWLKEVENKYKDQKYSTITELIGDIRLVLQNCYQYWGAGDPLTKKALKVEELLEKNINSLPEPVKQKCTLEATHGDFISEDKSDDESKKEEEKNSEGKRLCQMLKRTFVSKLLRCVVKNTKTDPMRLHQAEGEIDDDLLKEIEDWENTVLLDGNTLEQINSMWELPVIGHFFYLTFDVLSIEPISQFELERMMLMPQASIMLARVMTSILIPPVSRAKLEVAPPMPYNIWTAKLKTKIASWYRIYRENPPLKVFQHIGVEPEFWLVMGEINPLKDKQFHELSFLQRVWLLKSLCDYLLHNDKSIVDLINSIEPEELREQCLGKDKYGYTYHYFPEFSEVRIYKQAKMTDKKLAGYEAGKEEAMSVAAEDVKSKLEVNEKPEIEAAGIKKFLYTPPKCVTPPSNNFKLVATSVEDVRCLIDEFCNSDPQVIQGRSGMRHLVLRLKAIVDELEPIERKLLCSVKYIKKKMHKESTEYKNRSPDYVDPGFVFWERREKDHSEKEGKSVKSAVEENPSDQAEPETSERRGERRSKREPQTRFAHILDFDGNFGLEECDDDEEIYYEDKDDSEDEWTLPSKKKRNSSKKMKKLNALEHIKNAQELNKTPSDISSPVPNFTEVKIKKEIDKTENVGLLKVKSEADLSYNSVTIKQEPGVASVPIKQEVHVPSQTVVKTFVKLSAPVQQQKPIEIKRSNSPVSNVICISDDEPESPPDVKPIIDDPRSVKNVECVVPLVDQRIGRGQQFQPPVQNQYMPQFPGNSNMNVNQNMYMNNMQQVPPYMTQVRNSAPQMSNVRPPNVMYQQNSTSPAMKQPVPRYSTPMKNAVPSSPARNTQNVYKNSPNVKTPPGRNFVNNSSPQQMHKSPVPGHNFPRSPLVQSPRGGNIRGAVQSIMQSPGRGRPRMQQNIRMPSPVLRGSNVRQQSPQMSNKNMMNSPSLRARSPVVPQRMVSPQRMTSQFNSPVSKNRMPSPSTPQARRNLNFNSPTRPTRPPTPSQEPPLQIINTGGITSKNATTVEGKLLVGLTDDGSYGYHVVLPDGGKVTLSTSQLAELRAKNGGSLPQKVGVPMVHSFD